jgi:c-di-GMP-related signal transduction protein
MDDYSGVDGERPVRHAARQPILAADETVIGYKLLFRTDVVSHFAWNNSEGTSRTAIEISSLLGLNVLCDNRLAFIRCTRDILLEDFRFFLRQRLWRRLGAQWGRMRQSGRPFSN